MASTTTYPTLSLDSGLTHYLTEIRKFPMLTPDEELAYAKRLRDQGDREAAYHLVTSHLRLVAKIAMRYRGYGLPIADIISEGNVGLMQAVKRFEPDRGFRLATYAMWWIKASIQEYVLRSWSLVKIGTSAAQKKLIFQTSQDQSGNLGVGGRRSSPRARQTYRRQARRAGDRRCRNESATLRRPIAQHFDTRTGGWRSAGLSRRPGTQS
jgi:alternative sigma factor RpoH